MNERPRILVVDDDEDIRLLLRELLERAGLHRRRGGRRAHRPPQPVRDVPPALVILDVSMPELDGYQTLERIRDLSDVPVIMLTARTQELEKVRGLSAGADDYVAKPFGRQELLARVQALLRRTGGKAEVIEAYADDFLQIDYAQRRVTVQGRDVQLTPLEFKLLAAFVQNPNQVLSRDQLLELVWGDPYGVSGDQVKLYVGYLRQEAAAGRAGLGADRDRARLRLPLPALASSRVFERAPRPARQVLGPERLREVRVGARLRSRARRPPPARAPRAGSTFSSRSSSSARTRSEHLVAR